MKFKKGDSVYKDSGDYTFSGKVVAAFRKLSNVDRYVVEDDRGLLFIFSESNLKKAPKQKSQKRLTLDQRRSISNQMKARWEKRQAIRRELDRMLE